MKMVFIALILTLLLLTLKLFSSEGGLVDYWQTKQRLQALEQENAQQEKVNLQLKKQVFALQHHPEAIETLARQKLGMIGENEVFIQVIEVPSTHANTKTGLETSSPPTERLSQKQNTTTP